MPRTMFLFKQCIYGGAAGYRPRVQYVSTLLQHYNTIYTLPFEHCQDLFLTANSIHQPYKLLGVVVWIGATVFCFPLCAVVTLL